MAAGKRHDPQSGCQFATAVYWANERRPRFDCARCPRNVSVSPTLQRPRSNPEQPSNGPQENHRSHPCGMDVRRR